MKKWLISQLRRVSYRLRSRTQAKNAAKIARNRYTCAHCQGTFANQHVQLDHIVPVVDPVKGFTTWDEYITRLFCSESGYQVLCLDCHKAKTEAERVVRSESKKLLKVRGKKARK